MSVTISPETGLPELPDGYYWEISLGNSVYSRDDLWIALMKERRLLPDSVIEYTTVGFRRRDYEWEDPNATLEERVLYWATYVYNKVKFRFEVDKKREYAKTLVGKYPPKSLKDTE